MTQNSRPISIYIVLVISFLFLISVCGGTPAPASSITTEPSDTPTQPLPTHDIQTQTPFIITATPEIQDGRPASPKVIFLSMEDGGYYHLFAYAPQSLPLTRLTANSWDDITPALSPDGKYIAYSSRRNGYWDLYLLNLYDGTILRLTDTLEYDASPTWSPDGSYICYESYIGGSLSLYIRPAFDPQQPPILLINDSGSNTSPAWSPLGRQIAFISNRSGTSDVWIADLDHAGIFSNISNNSQVIESHPTWSPDGRKLAWSAIDPESGLTGIYIWDSQTPSARPEWAGAGDWPAWQDNDNITSRLSAPNQTFLTGYSSSGELNIPPVLLPGELDGLSIGVTDAVLPETFIFSAQLTQAPLFDPELSTQSDLPSGRASLVSLAGVNIAYPQLIEMAARSFLDMRTRLSALIGWDALKSLENAFIPLTTPPDPGLGEDWLYTGRAFTLDPVMVQGDWMVVVRQDFGQQVYWRIYLRTTAQDGSQGSPLSQVPWDFSARTTSSSAYENGGQLMTSVPPGYWIDLTSLAAQFGWQRLPALSNWRTYYAGARFNELVFSQGLDWRTAMLQLYPSDILVTPTIVIPPTRTPTRTPFWYRTPTPTRTPTARPTTTP